ncbi:AMP-binding protein [Amycolatopsis sp. H20-H5]|uniref:AMP-binding protein n=1 Tax=Amycolatopsis sp. H20-H5 TaxID=3046309 RepID=UPI002DB84D97|nr:AMP-binding protein [Amycolatopsis sp. H20-H5]MEC3975001.1 AMP-binding protein [Amycolatopsis sp. H20-H5]
MRDDVLEAAVVLEHPVELVWQLVAAPELYSRFVTEVSSCAPLHDERSRQYLMCFTGPGKTVVEQRVRAVVRRTDQLLVWGTARAARPWVAIEVHALTATRTRLAVRLAMADTNTVLLASLTGHEIATWLRDAATRMSHYLGTPAAAGHVGGRFRRGTPLLGAARVLAKAVVFTPGRPDRLSRQLLALSRWGLTVAGGYRASAVRAPQTLALRDENRDLTFAETEQRSTRLAGALASRGIREGHRVALMCRNHSGMVEAMIACGKLGADVVLVNNGLSRTMAEKVVGKHRPAAVLLDDEFFPVLGRLAGTTVGVSTWTERSTGYPRPTGSQTIDDLIAEATAMPPRRVRRQGRIIVLTSGTTGMPKGARRPNPRSLSAASGILSRIPLRVDERLFVAAPLFHTWGLAGLQIGMPLRATLSLARYFDPEDALRTVAEDRCTAMFTIPIMLQRILELPPHVRDRYDTSSLRIVASSGSAIPASVVTAFMDEFGDILYNLYGTTEVSSASIADPADLRAAPTTAGRCPTGTRISVIDSGDKQVPTGVDGRIFVGNEMVFDGYTGGTTLPTVDGLTPTGDRGHLDAAGRLFVSGREDEMIVSGGENVYPRPVEDVIHALPQVSEVAVLGVPDTEYGQRLAAYVVLRPGAALDPDGVRLHVHHRIARFAVPRDIYFVPYLPRNATGKVLKTVLRDDLW